MMYFYLKWKNKRPEDICLTKGKPENCNFIDEFKIKKEKLFICGDISMIFKIIAEIINIKKIFIYHRIFKNL